MNVRKLAAGTAVAGACLGLMGCAELATTMMMVSDQMAYEQGYFYDDAHESQYFGEGDCTGLAEFGIVNNQTYLRVRNTGSRPLEATVTWNTGFQSPFYLSPGETSQFVYMSPSIRPSNVDSGCSG
jgi:hypothetical protein